MSGEKKSMDPAVLTAIITVAGGIIVALITTLANRVPSSQPAEPTAAFPTWTNVPTATIANTPMPTDTVPPGEATSTAVPPTDTPAPSNTPEPPAVGEDWANDCISALWQAVPGTIQTQQENGCLHQPVGDFSASNGRVNFVVSRQFDDTQASGMFAPLSAEGVVSLKVHLDILQKGEIWMGVFAEPSLDSQGVMLVIPPGDVTKRLLILKTMPGQTKGPQTQLYDQTSATYDVRFTYKVGTVAVATMNESMVVNALPVPSSKKWLFIGYQPGKGSNSIGASFFDLALQ